MKEGVAKLPFLFILVGTMEFRSGRISKGRRFLFFSFFYVKFEFVLILKVDF